MLRSATRVLPMGRADAGQVGAAAIVLAMSLRPVLGWCSAVALMVVWLSAASSDAATPRPDANPSVLVLLPGQAGEPAASLVATGLHGAFIADPSLRPAIETEHLDVARSVPPAERASRLLEHYRSKYGAQPFDVVIAAGYDPAQFAVRERARLWPRAPVIVCAVDERTVESMPTAEGVLYVTTHYHVRATLLAALTVFPDTRHVALVGGRGPGEAEMHDLVRRAALEIEAHLDVIDLTAFSAGAMLAQVPALPPRTIVFLSSYLIDGGGRPVYGVDLIGPIADRRPVFSAFGFALGRGIVGGVLTDFEDLGREAGRFALLALHGQPLPPSPTRSAVPGMMRFDGRELMRWGLDERRLPSGSEVFYRQRSLWQQYRWHIVLTLAVVAGQTGLIVSLLVQRQRRQQAQHRLADSLRMEALTSEIAIDCATVPVDRVDERIRDCLRRVAAFLGVDGATLWQPAPDRIAMSVTHAWRRDGSPPPPERLDLPAFPYFRRRMEERQGGLVLARLGDLPPEAPAERAALAAAGVRSLAAIPLHAGDRWLGVLAFVNCAAERGWSDDLVQQLRALAEHFSHALDRAQSEAALASSTALTSAIVGALPGETAILDADGTILQTNEAWAAAATSDAETQKRRAVGGNYLEACRHASDMPPDVARKVCTSIQSVLAGEQDEFALEYPSARRGQSRWLEVRVRRLARLGGGAAVMHLDVTARRQAEAAAQRHVGQLAHLDRVAGMGQLASSLAHELNQPLTAILANAQTASRLLALPTPDLDELRACLTDIVSDDRRAAEVIRHMRRLLKKTDFVSLPVHLNDLVANTLSLVANDALLHSVSLQFVSAPALPVAYGDLVQIQQVILNLLTNAIVAAAGGSTRKVTVWTRAVAAPYMELGVHDSGQGIDEAALERLFEPFFTTKAEGLGMGLAISRTIVEAHGGRILAENDPAGGATFRVHLRTDRPESA